MLFRPINLSTSNLLKLTRNFKTSSKTNIEVVALSKLNSDDLGHSILIHQGTLPPGSPKTPHDVVAMGVKGAKILSLSSSVAGAVMVPVLSSYLWEAAAERPSMMMFAIVANTFLVLLSFTPLLLHFLAKRFPIDIFYNNEKKTFTTVHYNFVMQKQALRFAAADVVDAAVAPEMKKVWIPLATAFVAKKPLLISLDRNAYLDKLAFDELTKNVHIPPNHD
uniref:Transmembrane protein 70 homolog, mitochondrial n=1 Tax=Caenorhabditis japonica TaxID=281687 RepID=A0A8R1HP26_CAEJA